jgi:uncharacterized BrkB/YihY/UPF0761 family membrane protein
MNNPLHLWAVEDQVKNCKTLPTGSTDCVTVLPQVKANSEQLQMLLSVAFGIIAAVAVVTLIMASINFATAGSDTDKISRAKRSILYSLIGLTIALSAEIIVLTVVGRL